MKRDKIQEEFTKAVEFNRKERMENRRKRNIVLLFLAAVIWGFAFVAQSIGNVMGPFTFNSVRCILGSIVLIPVLLLQKSPKYKRRDNIVAGISCGVLLCIASNLQQLGIGYTTAGKAGFITALYIVFVPVAGLFLKRKCTAQAWAGVVLSLIGMACLCLWGGGGALGSEGKGELLLLLCAVTFTGHILVIDHFSERVNGVLVSCIQFLVCGILTGIPALLLERPTMQELTSCPEALLYAGILSCGVAYTLQVVGQKGVNPTVASLVLCLESVFSVVGGMLILRERMELHELLGCALMFAGIILAQLPSQEKETKSA